MNYNGLTSDLEKEGRNKLDCKNRLYSVRDDLNRNLDKLVAEVRGIEGGLKNAEITQADIGKIPNAKLKNACILNLKRDLKTHQEVNKFYRPVLELFKKKKEEVVKEILAYEKK